MSRSRYALLCSALALLTAAPAAGQQPQFRADVERTGDEPFSGTMYFGGEKMRVEGTSDGQEVTLIIDRSANSILVAMPADRMYMTMDLGSAPFEAPGAQSMDPANPCSSGEVTDCTNLGTENVNGYAARKWEYTMDGDRVTSWIATELRFPVRTVDADGATTDITNVAMGPQPASLFEPPAGYTPMDMGAMLGGRGAPPGGRGGRGGRGAPPPSATAGRGAVPAGAAPAGVDPAAAAQLTAQLQAMGLPPDQIAAALGQLAAVGTETNSAPWEQGDGWVVDLIVTANGSSTQTTEGGASTRETYSARYSASVPIPYGTPAVGAAMGPAWQLVPSLGSERGLAQPLTFSGTTEYRSEMTSPAACNDLQDGFRVVTEARGAAQTSTTDHGSMQMMMSLGRFEISGDLSTYNLMAGAGTDAPETSTTTLTYTTRCPNSGAADETSTETGEQSHGVQINLTGLPLPASPTMIRGSQTVPMRFEIGAFQGELPAEVEWTLRPIS